MRMPMGETDAASGLRTASHPDSSLELERLNPGFDGPSLRPQDSQPNP